MQKKTSVLGLAALAGLGVTTAVHAQQRTNFAEIDKIWPQGPRGPACVAAVRELRVVQPKASHEQEEVGSRIRAKGEYVLYYAVVKPAQLVKLTRVCGDSSKSFAENFDALRRFLDAKSISLDDGSGTICESAYERQHEEVKSLEKKLDNADQVSAEIMDEYRGIFEVRSFLSEHSMFGRGSCAGAVRWAAERDDLSRRIDALNTPGGEDTLQLEDRINAAQTDYTNAVLAAVRSGGSAKSIRDQLEKVIREHQPRMEEFIPRIEALRNTAARETIVKIRSMPDRYRKVAEGYLTGR